MFAIIIGLIVIALVVTLLLKGYYPQAILFMGGVVLLTCTAIFGWGDLLNAKQTTNFIGFDIFKVFSTGFSSRIAGLGLTLMAIGGFSRYWGALSIRPITGRGIQPALAGLSPLRPQPPVC